MMYFDDEDIYYVSGTLENLYVLKIMHDLGMDMNAFPSYFEHDLGGFRNTSYDILLSVIHSVFDLTENAITTNDDEIDQLNEPFVEEVCNLFKDEFLEYIIFTSPLLHRLEGEKREKFKLVAKQEFSSILDFTLLENSSFIVLSSEYMTSEFIDTVNSLVKVSNFLKELVGRQDD
ncbi:hypothetical protein AB3N04_01090 (plasmid) [Alkalihalophilus sp. As8PL]|uniref:Uncharacterized protein n=1 Tax=Alkalihalophilus sp. As8PL TaxID=3237103 RepID=A0AB39BNM5_9BACI